MMFGDKTRNTLKRLATSTALSAFMVAAAPAIADETATNDNDKDFVTRLHGSLNEGKSRNIIRDLRRFAAENPGQVSISFYG